MSPDAPLVFVVDDNEATRDTLVPMIQSHGWVTECLASVEAFLARPALARPGCLILEVSQALLDGLAFQKLTADRRDTSIVFTSSQRDIAMTVRAMKAGAVDLLTRPVASEAVRGAITVAIDRSRQLLAQEMAIRSLRLRYGSLSTREREVLCLVVAGLLNKQIGAELGISEITVKAHRGRMMRKMEAATLAELLSMAGRLKLDRPASHPGHYTWPLARDSVSRLAELAASLTGARAAF
jgi:FixJ family two-component response regulator